MAARAALFSLLKNDANLAFEEVYPTNSVDTAPEEFFAVIQWGSTTSAFGTVGTDRVTIWIHDRQFDYGRINLTLRRLKELLVNTIHRDGADGFTLTMAEWNGESPDLFDSGQGTIVRNAEFTVVSRYASL